MEPVVNGLEEEYAGKVEFRRIDANDEVGRKAFEAFRLRGHPSYVLLNPEGEVLWQSVGETAGEALEQQIQTALTGS